MAKSDKGKEASSKPNKGQDEKVRTFVNPATGDVMQATQREFRENLRAQGYVPEEEAAAGGDAEDAAGDDA